MTYEHLVFLVLGIFVGLVLAALVGIVWYGRKTKQVALELMAKERIGAEVIEQNHQLRLINSRLEGEGQSREAYLSQRVKDLDKVHEDMRNSFAALSKEALTQNVELTNQSFRQNLEHFFQANERDRHLKNEAFKSVVTPLKESLVLVDQKIALLEKNREGAYSGLRSQIELLGQSQMALQKETQVLARALKAPAVSGRFGEMQLRRVVELAGLSAHCDFVEQRSFTDEDDTLRPDMVVTLPAKKTIVVDAKAPLESFFKDPHADDETRSKELAVAIRRHLQNLKKKSYYKAMAQSPEFVVMFLPSEAFLARALDGDHELLDYAAQNDVILATPLTLVALLKAVAFGFRQEAMADNIEEVRKLSEQLIERIEKVSEHFDRLGKHLKTATESYNQTLASLDSRVLVTARKLSQIKARDLPLEEVLVDSPCEVLDMQP